MADTAGASLPAGNLVVNGSFETPVVADADDNQAFTSIPGWTNKLVCPQGPQYNFQYLGFGALDGNQCAELNTICPNGVYQDIPTTPGQAYSLTFGFSARPGSTASQNQMNVLFGGALVDHLGPRAPGADFEWTFHQYEVTASGAATRLQFDSAAPNPTDVPGTDLDFVSLVPLLVHVPPLQPLDTALESELFCPTSTVAIARGLATDFSSSAITVITNGVSAPSQSVSAILLRLDCASATSCVAVGITTDFLNGVVVPITNGVAGAPQVVAGTGSFRKVKCASAAACLAVDESGSPPKLVAITNGVAGPAQPLSGIFPVDMAIPNDSLAVVVGFDNTFTGAVVPVINGLVGAPQSVAGTQSLAAIDCADAALCVAVGGSGGPPGVNEGRVVAITNGVANAAQSVSGAGFLTNVSCNGACIATGNYALSSGFGVGAVVPIAGGVAGPVQYANGSDSLQGLDCHCGGCTIVGNTTGATAGGFLSLQAAAQPSISVTPSAGPIYAGGTSTATAHVSGGFNPHGEVTLSLYGPDDASCTTPIATETVPLTDAGTAISSSTPVGAPGTYGWVAAYGGDAVNRPASTACGDANFEVLPQTLTGRAYGLEATGTLIGNPLFHIAATPDTGDIETTESTTTAPPCLVTLLGPVSVHSLCASVTTTQYQGKSEAVSSVVSASVSLALIPAVTLGPVQTTSTTTCDGSVGATTINYLKVGPTVVIAHPTHVAPNTSVNLGVIHLVLNEQIPLTGPDNGLTVNGVHLLVNAGVTTLDVVIASAESDIAHCP